MIGQTSWTIRALLSLRPGAEWTIQNGVLDWLDSAQPRPTDEEISAEAARLEARESVPASLTRSQFFRMLARSGIITAEEASASAANGIMPATIAIIIAGMPDLERRDAEILWATAVTFERSNPLFVAAAIAGLATADQIDGLFRLGVTLP